ncbi:uncharacterized protein [Littorina saxatilis]|uniref:uncharacterized protein n=1 Tax=Littorina saxatilis TaxID=31220 RepID=UPI0038B4C112
MEEVVRRSTPQSHLNIPQLVGREDASVIVPTYDWHTFFGANFGFKPLPGIKPLGHFRFDSRQPGVVFYKKMIADAEQQFVLATHAMIPQLPHASNVIPAPGLSDVRRRYLFQHIREYVREDRRNLVCPDPAN